MDAPARAEVCVEHDVRIALAVERGGIAHHEHETIEHATARVDRPDHAVDRTDHERANGEREGEDGRRLEVDDRSIVQEQLVSDDDGAEEAATAEIFRKPLHPYTKHLIASLPRIGEDAPRKGRAKRG